MHNASQKKSRERESEIQRVAFLSWFPASSCSSQCFNCRIRVSLWAGGACCGNRIAALKAAFLVLRSARCNHSRLVILYFLGSVGLS